MLNNAEYVHILIDEESSEFAIQACENDADAMAFYKKPKPGKQVLVRWGNVKIAKMLMEMAGVEDCGKGIRFYGVYEEDDNAVIFSIKK